MFRVLFHECLRCQNESLGFCGRFFFFVKVVSRSFLCVVCFALVERERERERERDHKSFETPYCGIIQEHDSMSPAATTRKTTTTRTTTTRQKKGRGGKQSLLSSLTPVTPRREILDDAPASEEEEEEEATTTTTTFLKIRNYAMKILPKNNNNSHRRESGGERGVPWIAVVIAVVGVVSSGVALQAKEVRKIAVRLRGEGEKKLALDPVKKEVQKLHETLEKMKRDNVNTFCTKEEMERRWKEETTKMTNLNAKNDNGGGWRSRSGESTTSYDDRWTKAELARLTKDTDALKKVVNEEKPWDRAMQKTIDAWYKSSDSGDGGSPKKRTGWFGGKDVRKLSPPWTAKDEEIEKAMEQLKVDLEDVKLKIAKKGLSTQTAMQRMTHALADKTGLVDYASVHGGGRVLKHSTLSPLVARESGPITALLMYFRGKAAPHPKADEWLLKQTLEPPGDCLALRGAKGYVDVHLKEKITVSGFTLEHVNPLIAYDRSSAPKGVTLGAWGMFPKVGKSSNSNSKKDNDGSNDDVKMSWRYEEFGNFTFDPTVGDGITTFTFSEDKIIGTTDRVRFSVDSNHGNAKWTCVYRLRVHGSKK